MCGVVYILLYYVLYQSSLWLPDFNKLFVIVIDCVIDWLVDYWLIE